ncbi:MAG: hypothetical protein RLZZ627_1719 [Pseudomonadota bacterium]
MRGLDPGASGRPDGIPNDDLTFGGIPGALVEGHARQVRPHPVGAVDLFFNDAVREFMTESGGRLIYFSHHLSNQFLSAEVGQDVRRPPRRRAIYGRSPYARGLVNFGMVKLQPYIRHFSGF